MASVVNGFAATKKGAGRPSSFTGPGFHQVKQLSLTAYQTVPDHRKAWWAILDLNQ
jgi:hypothetical protein